MNCIIGVMTSSLECWRAVIAYSSAGSGLYLLPQTTSPMSFSFHLFPSIHRGPYGSVDGAHHQPWRPFYPYLFSCRMFRVYDVATTMWLYVSSIYFRNTRAGRRRNWTWSSGGASSLVSVAMVLLWHLRQPFGDAAVSGLPTSFCTFWHSACPYLALFVCPRHGVALDFLDKLSFNFLMMMDMMNVTTCRRCIGVRGVWRRHESQRLSKRERLMPNFLATSGVCFDMD
jgi:hypothetical protein